MLNRAWVIPPAAIERAYVLDAPPEERLEQAFRRFVPRWLARIAATDMVVISHALIGLRGFVMPQPVGPYSYVNGSKLVIAGAMVGAAVIPDGVLFWLLLPHTLWWLSLSIDVLDVWAFLWLFGLYGTMLRRPHTVTIDGIVLRNGILGRIDVHPSSITQVRDLGVIKRRRLPREKGRACALLMSSGVPLVEIRTSEMIAVRHRLLPGHREVDHIFVGSDAPAVLCRELEALARSHHERAPAH